MIDNHVQERIQGVSNGLMIILTILLAAILGIYVWSQITGRGTNHADLADRITHMERSQAVMQCLLLIDPDERTTTALIACQTEAAQLIP
jgi:hypothetical protein